MTEEVKTTNAAASEQAESGKTFTQEELNRILADRLAQERKKYTDYDTLKQQASELQQIRESQKSEEQKLKDALAKAESDKNAALQSANDRLLRAAFIAEAAKAGVAHPEDAFALADKAGVKVDEKGDVIGVAEAVTTIVTAGRLPLVTRIQAPNVNAGAGSADRTKDLVGTLTAEEQMVAAKMGITAEAYAKSKFDMKKAKEKQQ